MPANITKDDVKVKHYFAFSKKKMCRFRMRITFIVVI